MKSSLSALGKKEIPSSRHVSTGTVRNQRKTI
jgi:hypothetical protein